VKLAKLRIENFRQLGTGGKPLDLDFTDALGRVRDFTLLVGPNGCGKTTILDAIACAFETATGLPTVRPRFERVPRAVVTRSAAEARVTCEVRFDAVEVEATTEIIRESGELDLPPAATEVTLTWRYPHPDRTRDHGAVRCTPGESAALFLNRVRVARLLATRTRGWDALYQAGGVFTFDQDRTGLSRTISRQLWNIIQGTEGAARKSPNKRTADPRTLLIALALQSLVPRLDGVAPDHEFERLKETYARICSPRKIIGAVRDEMGEFGIEFTDGTTTYQYDGLSSGEKMVLLLLTRFVAEHIHRSIVLIDEVELNQHPLWQRRLLHMIPQMGVGNQIIATTHSPYLRDAVPPDAVIDLGELDDRFGGGA
jgi:predicted ATPase